MKGTPSLFEADATVAESVERREKAMRSAEQHAQPEWKDYARKVVLRIANARPSFTADDVWDALAKAQHPKTHDPRALGPVFKALSLEGLIRHTRTFVPSRRRHATPIPVWERSKPQ